mgnify:CR=1 FL=1
MRTLTNIVVGIIIGILIFVLAVGVAAYIVLTGEGMVGKIDDAVDEINFSDDVRALSLLAYLNQAVAGVQNIGDKAIGEVEKLIGTDGISVAIADTVGVSAGVIKTSSLSGLGETLSSNLTLSGMSDSFGIALPSDIPLFQNDEFLSEPVSDAFGSIDGYTLDSFIEVVYDDEATADNPASGGLLQNLGKLPLSELSSEMDSIIDNTYITDVLDVDESSSEIMKYLASGGEGGNPVKIGELDGAVNDMKISNAVEIGDDASPVLKYLRDCELTITDADGNVTVEIGASLSNINEAIKQMTIGDAVEIASTSSRVLQYMKDFKLDELDAGIKAMTIADAIAINEDSHAVINAIADLTLDDLSRGDILQSKLDTLRLGQVITVTETSPKILKALQYSRLGTLGEAVDRLEMQDVFENIDSGVLSLISPTTLIDDIPNELTAAIKKTSLYGLQQIDLFEYNISGVDYFTYIKTIERSSTHNALIGDVVQVIAERTFDGLTVEFVKLYRDTNDKLLYAGLPDGSGTPVRIDATTGAEGMVILDAEDVNKILGVLPDADMYSAVITVDISVGSDLTVLGGSYDTLFSIDMQDADGNLWIGDASAKVEFPNKVGGYAFFHANGSVHLNGAKDGITTSGAASPEDIPVATIAGGTKPMTLIELILEDWSGTGA